jgi:hypothetical protein
MARHKKDGTYLNVRIETSIYNRLNDLCDDAGQTKTTAVERALTEYLDNYDKKKRLLEELVIPFDEPVDCSMINREIPCYFIGIMSSEVIFNEQLSCFIV